MVNSIRAQLDPATTISEIRLMLSQNANCVCVVVEGDNDEKLFCQLLTPNVEMFQSYSGKAGVDDIVKNQYVHSKRVIGIRDKDYGQHPSCDRVFFCDYSCAEMMIVSSDSCFRKTYVNTYLMGPYSYDQLRFHILSCLEKLSIIRMLNEKHHWGIILSGINPGRHYDSNQLTMDASIINEINNKNQSNKIDAYREGQCNSQSKCTTLQDYLEITNGHDFIQVLRLICEKNHQKHSIKEIEIALRSSFSDDAFRRTSLYAQLTSYQNANQIAIVS